MAAAGEGPAHRQDRQGLPGAARPGAVPVSRRERRAPRRHIGRRQRLPARRSPAATSRPRTSAPGPAPCWPRWRCRSSRHFDTEARRRRRTCSAAIERVAARLGNTPTICRKCYVHPEVLTAYVEGQLLLEIKERGRGANCAKTCPPEARGGRGAGHAGGAPEAHAEGALEDSVALLEGGKGKAKKSKRAKKAPSGGRLASREPRKPRRGLKSPPPWREGQGWGLLAEADLPDRPRLLPKASSTWKRSTR